MKQAADKICIMLGFMMIVLFPGKMAGQDIQNLKNKKPVTFHGSIANTFLFLNSGKPGENPQLIWAVSANATLSVYGIDLPFSFTFSDKKANYSQPFNQFGLSPRYKWITVHLGYRNVNFSNFVMAGYTFLGAGVELNPEFFVLALSGAGS